MLSVQDKCPISKQLTALASGIFTQTEKYEMFVSVFQLFKAANVLATYLSNDVI